MSKIIILDEKTANQIAAGEVIERPASVVKEMVENAIDAGASQITVEIKNGGISYIRITDNGDGMEGDDVEIAFERHATSKMRRIEDLDGLSTMGFRGEALASIASVSHLEVATKTQEASSGTELKMEGGRVLSVAQTGCPKGTSFIVRNLFYNTPARYKFLKKDAKEAGYISDIMERLALAHPDISFKYIQNNQIQLHTPGNNDLLSVIYSIYGKDIAKSVMPVSYENGGLSLSGFLGKPEIARGTRNSQSIFLNGRYIKSRMVTSALEEAYKTLLMQNKFPFCVVLIKASPESFDVNVHPQKLEVRFANESMIYSAVYNGVKNTLLGISLVREFEPQNGPDNVKNAEESVRQASLFESPQVVEIAKEPIRTPIAWSQSSKLREAQNEHQYENSHEVIPIQGVDIINDRVEETASPFQESVLSQKEVALQELKEAAIVGQAFDTYILLQNADTLYIIDQHAAHERIRYETLKQRLIKDESFSQGIMEPFIIKLTAKEYDFVMEKQEAFQKLGFELEAFGVNTIIIRSVPDFYDSSFSIVDFNEILDRWIQTNSNESGISDATIYMMSCKAALKANRALSKEEIHGLVASLCTMENPYTCVHGRPVIISMDKREFEKRFKRI